jgi:hypothetical protein
MVCQLTVRDVERIVNVRERRAGFAALRQSRIAGRWWSKAAPLHLLNNPEKFGRDVRYGAGALCRLCARIEDRNDNTLRNVLHA